ncbi:MAG TPA: 1-deoxy-D-xylulose-5-phosphate synthase [Acidimicrobiales bacterium]|nr:1-deoxy-D-xylulose-5-phosphate synthase [Acidimicrobiales bacterium]
MTHPGGDPEQAAQQARVAERPVVAERTLAEELALGREHTVAWEHPALPDRVRYPILEQISSPADVKALSLSDCTDLAAEVRSFVVESVTRTGGHLGSNLGAVEVTIALHRVFDSPHDALLFDTGHQSYVHKLLTGRMKGFAALRQAGGLSGYPSRTESEHDWIENSHASTALSYAHGLALAFATGGDHDRRVVALVGDGALTGGMAYEALNNIGHAGARVVVVLNDNGRSYAPTVSKLSESLTQLRLNPSYGAVKARVSRVIGDIPLMGPMAGQSLKGLTAALRELVEPHVFFEALGVRYAGPLDGHDVGVLEQALRRAAAWPGPIVLHILTRKGKGYGPAEDDEVQCLHDLKAQAPPLAAPGSATDSGALVTTAPPKATGYDKAFSKALLDAAEADRRVVGITAAMPGPTGLLPFQARFPERFLDVGIAEQHAMTAAAGMALGGMRPVVAIYSTFLSRCFDQQNLDVGLHQAPVVICADRAGITGDDGPSHHGVLDMVLGLAVPGLSIFAPSEPAEIAPMLAAALELPGPSLIRWPKTPPEGTLGAPGSKLASRCLRRGAGEVVLVGIGKMAARSLAAAGLLALEGIDADVHDLRVVRPADERLVEEAARAQLVVTVEDGLAHGGAGAYFVDLVEEAAEEAGVAPPRHLVLGVPTRYLPQAKPNEILHQLGLDGEGIAASVLEAIAARSAAGERRRARSPGR